MTVAPQLARRFALTHQLLLEAATSTPEDDLRWVPGPTAPPIAFHAWHCGRWADRWAEALGAGGQVWTQRSLASDWGFPAALGGGHTGMQLPDQEAAALPFPDRAALVAYLRAAFAALEQALDRLTDDALLIAADDFLGERPPLGDSLLRQLAHANRHLGMIEALRGVRGTHGTATV
jgi:DinB superfamily